MEAVINAYKMSLKTSMEENFGGLGLDERIVLKRMLIKIVLSRYLEATC
jgi:hypothetical protein